MADSRFFQIGLPQLPTNVDPKIEPDLRDLYNALRNLSYQIGQYGGFEPVAEGYNNANNVEYTAGPYKRRLYAEATEAITYGQLVNILDTAGVPQIQLADATTSAKPCHGICNTLGTCAIGATIEVALPGCYVTSIGGMTCGRRYFLSAAFPGGATSTAPAVAGNIVQPVGFALTPTIFYFWPSLQWTVV